MRWRVEVIGLAMFGLLSMPGAALATAPHELQAECKTHTERDQSTILLPLRSETQPLLPEHAVEIQVGETLCLSAQSATPDGALESLAIVPEGRAPGSGKRGICCKPSAPARSRTGRQHASVRRRALSEVRG